MVVQKMTPHDSQIPTLDLRGQTCPTPVLNARIKLESLPAGSMLRILTDDQAADSDIPALIKRIEYTLKEHTKQLTFTEFIIEKPPQ